MTLTVYNTTSVQKSDEEENEQNITRLNNGRRYVYNIQFENDLYKDLIPITNRFFRELNDIFGINIDKSSLSIEKFHAIKSLLYNCPDKHVIFQIAYQKHQNNLKFARVTSSKEFNAKTELLNYYISTAESSYLYNFHNCLKQQNIDHHLFKAYFKENNILEEHEIYLNASQEFWLAFYENPWFYDIKKTLEKRMSEIFFHQMYEEINDLMDDISNSGSDSLDMANIQDILFWNIKVSVKEDLKSEFRNTHKIIVDYVFTRQSVLFRSLMKRFLAESLEKKIASIELKLKNEQRKNKERSFDCTDTFCYNLAYHSLKTTPEQLLPYIPTITPFDKLIFKFLELEDFKMPLNPIDFTPMSKFLKLDIFQNKNPIDTIIHCLGRITERKMSLLNRFIHTKNRM